MVAQSPPLFLYLSHGVVVGYARQGADKERRWLSATLIELMVVILIVSILAAVALPTLRGKSEASKWSEATATVGIIRSVVRAEFADDPAKVGAWTNQAITGVMSDLGFMTDDFIGRYFDDSHFTIASVDANGNATITVTAPAGLTGSGQLDSANGWVYTP